MFDKYQPFQELQKKDFMFQTSRYEIWVGGKKISNGETTCIITAKVIKVNSADLIEVSYNDTILNSELATKNLFDKFITASDRLQLIVIPEETNSENVAILLFKMTIGATRAKKDFNKNEPFCCNLFTKDGEIIKITFSFSHPEKLIEFYK